MSNELNHITLNATLLENLYPYSLVDIAGAPTPAPTRLRFLGNHARSVTVLVSDPDHTFLPEDHLSFLSKMMLACKLNTGDIAIVNMATGTSLDQVISELSPNTIISFGVTFPGAGGDLLTIGTLGNIAFLPAPGLADLTADTEQARTLKGRLWTSLKTLFSIA